MELDDEIPASPEDMARFVAKGQKWAAQRAEWDDKAARIRSVVERAQTTGFADRLKMLRKSEKLVQADVARRLGVSTQAVSQWETGSTMPTRESIKALANLFSVSTHWLTYGGLTPLASTPGDPTWVPILDLHSVWSWVPNGAAVPPEGHSHVEVYQPPEGVYFAFKVRESAMLARFKAGDLVICDTGIEPEPGDFVVATVDGGSQAIFRKYRLRGSSPGGMPAFDLVPLNEDFPTIRIPDQEPGQIIAVMTEHRSFRGRGMLDDDF